MPLYKFILAVAFAAAPFKSWACSSCGCTLSSDWESSSEPGFKLDLRYDYINQNQLRAGTTTIRADEASRRQHDGDSQEVEAYTENRYLTATGEYTLNENWKMSLVVPYIVRHHSTLGTASDGATPGPGGEEYTSNTSNLGDGKVLARYQGLTPEHNLGFIFGFKLATGRHDLKGTSTDPTDDAPPLIDRGLQPGSGSTDVILGVSYMKPLNKNWDYFGEALFQTAVLSDAHYRPGDGYNLNLGFRYLGLDAVAPQIQLNTRYVLHDTGDAADKISTGGTLVYLSPGAVVPISKTLEAYAFAQLPLYQNLLGVQLAPSYTASLGVRYVF